MTLLQVEVEIKVLLSQYLFLQFPSQCLAVFFFFLLYFIYVKLNCPLLIFRTFWFNDSKFECVISSRSPAIYGSFNGSIVSNANAKEWWIWDNAADESEALLLTWLDATNWKSRFVFHNDL